MSPDIFCVSSAVIGQTIGPDIKDEYSTNELVQDVTKGWDMIYTTNHLLLSEDRDWSADTQRYSNSVVVQTFQKFVPPPIVAIAADHEVPTCQATAGMLGHEPGLPVQ